MSQPLTSEYWNKRYHQNEIGWDIGYISTPLKAYFDGLTDKNLRILIPGAGNGYEAEYLVNHSFRNVFVCDIAEQPLINLQKRCPELNQSNLLHLDFFKMNVEPAKKKYEFDLIIEQTFFCALHPSLRKQYFQKMHDLLAPGGHLVGLLFNDPLNNDKPPFGGSPLEYKQYFEGLFHAKTYETCYNSIPPRSGRELFINLEKL